jgi:DNA phosphorothioation-dependent restriction protein DptH
MTLPENTRDRIREMLRKGRSAAEIADALGVGKMQVAALKAHMTMQERGRLPASSTESRVMSATDSSRPAQARESLSHWQNTEAPTIPDPEAMRSSILIGTDVTFGRKVYWDFSSKTGSTNPHTLIVGETGFGKTYAAQCIVAELSKKGISVLIFDYGQGFGKEEASRSFLELVNPKQIEASKNGISINPLRALPDDAMGPVNVAHRIADTFCRVFPRMGIQQREALTEAVETTFKKAGIYGDSKDTWSKEPPQFQEVHKNLKTISDDRDNALRSQAKTAFSHVSSFFRFKVIRDSGERLLWDQLISGEHGSVWIIQLKGLEHHISMITTEMLLWDLISHIQSGGPSDIQLFVVLDEAHKLSFEPGTPVDWILREGRKFGLGLILASQQLEDYSKVAISNTATKLIFQNQDDNYALSKALEKKCKNITNHREISRIITTLERGKAFFMCENSGRIVSIDEMESRR